MRAVLPGLAVLLAAGLGLTLLDESRLALISGRYGLVVYAVGVVLAAVFHRSRVVAGLLGLAYLDLAFVGVLGAEGALLALATVVVALLGLLALTRDRGVRSRAGVVQLLACAAVVALAHALARDPVALAAFADLRVLPPGWSTWTGLPEAALIAGAGALVLATYGAYRWRGPVERALLWAQAFLLASVHPSFGATQTALLLMAAGVVLSLSVLEQSYFMAYRDELTGLPGRRALMRDLADVGATYAVAMVDVDHFKQFNDTHGHDVGDQVLQLVATRLSASPEGRPYRYGGEEFTLLFPKLTREDALARAEVVRAAVEEATFSLRSWRRPRKRPSGPKPAKKKKRPRTLSVTVSIGLADSTGGDASPETILKKADEALYRAKEEGRNRVSL